MVMILLRVSSDSRCQVDKWPIEQAVARTERSKGEKLLLSIDVSSNKLIRVDSGLKQGAMLRTPHAAEILRLDASTSITDLSLKFRAARYVLAQGTKIGDNSNFQRLYSVTKESFVFLSKSSLIKPVAHNSRHQVTTRNSLFRRNEYVLAFIPS